MEVVFGCRQEATTRTAKFPLFHDKDCRPAIQHHLFNEVDQPACVYNAR